MTEPTQKHTLLFENGFGGYDKDEKEYVIRLSGQDNTPAPWVNILANPMFGSLITESGASFSWYENSYEFRLTPWVNDPVQTKSGELFYIRDEDSNDVWSPTPYPLRDGSAYTIRHGLGYSVFSHTSHELVQELTEFVSKDFPIKFCVLRLTNHSTKTRHLTVTFYLEWVLGDFRERTRPFIQVTCDKQGITRVKNPFSKSFANYTAFAGTSCPRQQTFVTDRVAFFGKDNELGIPEALKRGSSSKIPAATIDPCSVVQASVTLEPNKSEEVVFFLGQAKDEEIPALFAHYTPAEAVNNSLTDVKTAWQQTTEVVTVQTPSPALDILFNNQLLYQTLACRLWGRTGFYQPGGAFGYRDQLQDTLAIVWSNPDKTREHILLAASKQFTDGNVMQWWHPPEGRGVQSHSSDDHLWLAYTTLHYIRITGNTDILDQEIHFLQAEEDQSKASTYNVPPRSQEEASIYEHCIRGIEQTLLTKGPNGLPLIRLGDWNDSMNRVGPQGKGESVWLALFLITVLNDFAPVCEERGDKKRAVSFRETAANLAQIVENVAWDGEWFLRAFFDDGRPVGSHKNLTGKIDSLPQSWSVIAKTIDKNKSKLAMASVDRYLVDKANQLVLLLDPPYEESKESPGYISTYPPGVRENGAQYTHAALWVVWAFAALGDGNKAMELLNMTNPFLRSDNRAKAEKYSVEPYVVASDIYSKSSYAGKGGWTWYTGSAGLMYVVIMEQILGLLVSGEFLEINPCIPSAWDGFSATFHYKTATYEIAVENPQHVCHGVTAVKLEGKTVDGKIELVDDKKKHQVTVTMG